LPRFFQNRMGFPKCRADLTLFRHHRHWTAIGESRPSSIIDKSLLVYLRASFAIVTCSRLGRKFYRRV
jgi:hypothetical protein